MSPDVEVVAGTGADAAAAAAALHVAGIDQGFLTTLGPSFLARLYRRVARSPHSFLLVARQGGPGGAVRGFLAGTTSTRRLYAEFCLRDGVGAVVSAPGPILRGAGSALETLRYGHGADDPPSAGGARGDHRVAELLSMAVDPEARGQGIGTELVECFFAEIARRGVMAARVVVAADNRRASGLYRSAGFRPGAAIEVHRGRRSELLVWP